LLSDLFTPCKLRLDSIPLTGRTSTLLAASSTAAKQPGGDPLTLPRSRAAQHGAIIVDASTDANTTVANAGIACKTSEAIGATSARVKAGIGVSACADKALHPGSADAHVPVDSAASQAA
jgi:hypothetical protein